MPFVLEVLRFQSTGDDHFEHVGYMRARFMYKKDAASYYDRHNPRMRALNAHGTWTSDWDPHTNLAFTVRTDRHVRQTVAPFDPADEPVVTAEETWYTWLK